MPKVSVIMSVYNGSRYLSQSLESILNQTFTDFEFIIVDDGSTDNTWEILTEYAARDSRIILIRNEKNIGLTKSLNKGLARAQGEYIARQDADDFSLPDRFEHQVRFLDTHSEVGVLGTAFYIIDEDGNVSGTVTPPQESALLHWLLLFCNPIPHPTVMARRKLICAVNGYNPEFVTAQDYDLWARLSDITRFAILPIPLVCYRRHTKSITYQYNNIQKFNTLKVAQRLISNLLNEPISLETVQILRSLNSHFANSDNIFQIAQIIYKLCQALLTKHNWSYSEKRIIRYQAAKRIFTLFRHNIKNLRTWKILILVSYLDWKFIVHKVSNKVLNHYFSILMKFLEGKES